MDEITPTNGGGGAYAVNTSNDIFSVGADISHWNGASWSVAESLSAESYPALRNTYVAPNGDIWAAGRTVQGSNNFRNLVYRTAVNNPVFEKGPSQNMSYISNSGNYSLDSLLKTADNDISQVLTYSVVTAPAHGTLAGFPATAVTNNGYATPSGTRYTTTPGYTGSDQFVIKVNVGSLQALTTVNVSVSGTLPLTLISFTAKLVNNEAILNWKTENQINTVSFVVERSKDGTGFTSIATVGAVQGSSGLYQYSDRDRLTDVTSYYRLKIIDRDSKVSYSPVIKVSQATISSGLNFFPNPVRESASLMITSAYPEEVSYEILHVDGRSIAKSSIQLATGINTVSLPMQGYASGKYFIIIRGKYFNKTVGFVKM